jgi:hypothetical protein
MQKKKREQAAVDIRKSEKPPKRRPEDGSRRLQRQTTAKALRCFPLLRHLLPACGFPKRETFKT